MCICIFLQYINPSKTTYKAYIVLNKPLKGIYSTLGAVIIQTKLRK